MELRVDEEGIDLSLKDILCQREDILVIMISQTTRVLGAELVTNNVERLELGPIIIWKSWGETINSKLPMKKKIHVCLS